MIQLKQKSKVFIACPYYKTGGPKSLHQLANELINSGIETYIIYYSDGVFTGENDILFSFCKAKVATNIIDNNDNVLLVSETATSLLERYSKIKKVIWWLSLDYYFSSSVMGRVRHVIRYKRLPRIMEPVMFFKLLVEDLYCHRHLTKVDTNSLKKYHHLYNCEYEKEYLMAQGVNLDSLLYLCGPLEERFLDLKYDKVKRFKKDIVAYNPAKMDMKYLEKVKAELSVINSNIEFVAIQNMSREQVYETLRSAKIYIDFGYFPGPERMPREAVALYCNIITSTEGSAKNDLDVMIPREFKFDIKNEKTAKEVSYLINKMIMDYKDYVKYGDQYREKVWKQITSFSKSVEEIFEIDAT